MMDNNNTQVFKSMSPSLVRYELRVNRKDCLIQIKIENKEEVIEYDIPFCTIAEAEMSTYGFLTQEQIQEKKRIESSEAILELADYNKQKVSTNNGSMLGRAIVGGLIAGPVGAIVGGATASKTVEDTGHAYKREKEFPMHTGYTLSIRLDDIDVPYIKYDCGENSDDANIIYSILKILIRENISKGFTDSKKIKVRTHHKETELKIQRGKNLYEKDLYEKVKKQNKATENNNVKPIGNNSIMVLYAICQAIFTGLLLTVWNAGWWPSIIIIISFIVQIYPLMGIFCTKERDFSFFSKGIIVASLIPLLFEVLLPYFATANINLYLSSFDLNLYIRSYEGGLITFLVCPPLATLILVGMGYFIESILPKNKKILGKCSLSAFIVSTMNFLIIGSASLVLKIDGNRFIPCTIIGCLYALVSSILIGAAGMDFSSIREKKKYNYKEFALGFLFQLFLVAIVIAFCAALGIIEGYSFPISADEVW